MFIFGFIAIVLGIYCIMKGRMPLIKQYSGIKDISKHCRIEGSAVLCVGLLVCLYEYFKFDSVMMMVGILMICIITLIIEIVCHVI